MSSEWKFAPKNYNRVPTLHSSGSGSSLLALVHTVRLDVRVVGQVCKPPLVVPVSNMVGEPGLDFENSIPSSDCQSVKFSLRITHASAPHLASSIGYGKKH
jgi:hypothetical protein